MSRITSAVSSPTLPITNVSPAGIAASHRTRPAPALAGVAPGLDGGLAEGAAVGLDVTIGCAVGRAEVVLEEGETEHAENASAKPMAAPLKITR
ncbi:MAG: hypothetical protein PVSMB3_20890 [Candidatus Dormibacteraceae bacterium]